MPRSTQDIRESSRSSKLQDTTHHSANTDHQQKDSNLRESFIAFAVFLSMSGAVAAEEQAIGPDISGNGYSQSSGDGPKWPDIRLIAFRGADAEENWESLRPNLLGIEVPPEWDFYDIIATDRPDFTDSPFTVGKNVWIVESGFTYRKINEEETRIGRRTLPETLFRYGITDELELRVRWFGYNMFDITDVPHGTKVRYYGTDDTEVGFKYEICQQYTWMPMLCFLGTAFVPTGTHDLSGDAVQPRLNLVGGWGINRWLYLKMSGGLDFMSRPAFSVTPTRTLDISLDRYNEYHLSSALLYQVAKHWGGYSEWFVLMRDGSENDMPDHFANTGIYLYTTPNVQFDWRIGYRISERIDEMYTGVGFSVRWGHHPPHTRQP
jgi:hypothetical protein